jgi:hypothetical protein
MPVLAPRVFLTSMLALSAVSCAPADQERFSFYEERVEPILVGGCQRQTTGCHVDDGRGFALGNLDLSSYDALLKRSDTLTAYGPYPVGLLLLKAGEPVDINVRTVDPPDPANPNLRSVRITTDIRHGGGEGAIAEGSADYAALKQWIERGYSRDGVARDFPSENRGDCTGGVARVPGLDMAAAPSDPALFQMFVDDVQPVLLERCAGSSCHGAASAGLKLACGDDDDELRSNFNSVVRYLNEVAVSSELLRRPLATARGGVYHEGGDVFEDTDDAGYRALRELAEEVVERDVELTRFAPEDEGLRFFANRVQPVLVKKGCMFLGCHSPAMFHDLRLRGGAGGDFSEIATRRNHEMSKLLLALESEDPNASRLIAKNLCPPDTGGSGIKHRGGVLFEDFGVCGRPEGHATRARCDMVDADTGDLNEVPAYCVMARWQEIERDLAIERGEIPDAPAQAVAYVARPRDVGGPTEFDAFRGGADLMFADVTFDAEGVPALSGARSRLSNCGLGPDVDVRGPAVSWDGTRIAFAARASADAPLRIYEVRTDGSECAPIAALAPEQAEQNGIPQHDFDPAYSPDGRIVFASSRGYIAGDLEVRGPTRTPARLEPNANLFVFDPRDGSVRQLTFLLDQELSPSFMTDGRVIFTTEKRAQDFHQLAGRRINMDGGDYHPLFAQRSSVGFESATEIVELPNRNLAMVASTLSARDGGGSIVIVNRSIGPDQDDRDPGDRAYIHAITAPISGALASEAGVFRSPAPLPDGSLLASCDLGASDLSVGPMSYSLCWLDATGQRAPVMIASEPDRSIVEAVAVHARARREVFRSRLDEANGATNVASEQSDATVHYLDVPVLGSLLFANTREGRDIDARVGGLRVFRASPPPSSLETLSGDGVVEDERGRYYESLSSLGWVAIADDGSAKVRLPAGVPLTLALTGPTGDVLPFEDGAAFSGEMRQRESFQLYPGERTRQSMPRHLFDGMCAGCHGSVSGRELDVGVSVDVLTSASLTETNRTTDLLGR